MKIPKLCNYNWWKIFSLIVIFLLQNSCLAILITEKVKLKTQKKLWIEYCKVSCRQRKITPYSEGNTFWQHITSQSLYFCQCLKLSHWYIIHVKSLTTDIREISSSILPLVEGQTWIQTMIWGILNMSYKAEYWSTQYTLHLSIGS